MIGHHWVKFVEPGVLVQRWLAAPTLARIVLACRSALTFAVPRRIWWRAIWCTRCARRWRCWRSRSKSCTNGTRSWSARTPCSNRWPTAISCRNSPPSSPVRAARPRSSSSRPPAPPPSPPPRRAASPSPCPCPTSPTSPRREVALFSARGGRDDATRETSLRSASDTSFKRLTVSNNNYGKKNKKKQNQVCVCHGLLDMRRGHALVCVCGLGPSLC